MVTSQDHKTSESRLSHSRNTQSIHFILSVVYQTEILPKGNNNPNKDFSSSISCKLSLGLKIHKSHEHRNSLLKHENLNVKHYQNLRKIGNKTQISENKNSDPRTFRKSKNSGLKLTTTKKQQQSFKSQQ